MRIAIIAHGLSDGGAERVASIVANHFANEGHKVLFLAVYSPDREYALDPKVAYCFTKSKTHSKFIKYISRSAQILYELASFKCDIAFSFIINETCLASLCGVVPIVYSLRIDPGDVMRRKSTALFCKICYNRAPSLIFQTRGARDFFPQRIRDKGVVIGNPLTDDLPFWDALEHDNVIMTACRLSEQKNLTMLIDAFYRFHKLFPEYELHIYGKGEMEGALKEHTSDLALDRFVRFPGHSKNIHEIMSKASVFVLPSNFEGLSNSMLEALAIGVPTICTDCPPGGAAEYITDGENGFLIPVGDTEALFEKLCFIVKNQTVIPQISEKARLIRTKLNSETIMSRWDDIVKKYDHNT